MNDMSDLTLHDPVDVLAQVVFEPLSVSTSFRHHIPHVASVQGIMGRHFPEQLLVGMTMESSGQPHRSWADGTLYVNGIIAAPGPWVISHVCHRRWCSTLTLTSPERYFPPSKPSAYYPQLDNEDYTKKYDLLMSYKLDSDVVTHYFFGYKEAFRTPPPVATAQKINTVAYVNRNWWGRGGLAG